MMFKRGIVPSFLFPFLSLLLMATGSIAGEFSADLTIAEGKVVKQGRIFVKGERYRMEIDDPRGPQTIVLVLPDKGICRVLVPRYERFLEVGLDEGIMSMFDPFLSAESMKEYYSIVPEGTESVAGHACLKEAFKYGDDPILYRWTAQDLGFPLKIEMVTQKGYYTELRSPRSEAVKAQLFDIPAGFKAASWQEISQLVDQDAEMTAKAQAWAERQPMSTSLDARLKAGDEFHALLGDGMSIGITGRSMATEDFLWSVTSLKNGQASPARDLEGPQEIAFAPDSGVDGIILRCREGEVNGKISLTGFGSLVRATRSVEEKDSGGGSGRSLPAEITFFRLILTSLEDPENSRMPVRISLTLEGPRDGSGKDENIEHRLEPGETVTFERAGLGAIGGYAFSLVGPGGRARVECTIDFRPPDQQDPF